MSYKVQRESWEDAFKYVEKIANWASADAVGFERDYVWGEVDEMIAGLRGILAQRDFEEFENTFPDDKEELRYLFVRKTCDFSGDAWNAKPEEMLALTKIEKVVGALALLERLKEIVSIESRVSATIVEIIDAVKNQMTDVERIICSVKNDIARLEKDIEVLSSNVSELSNAVKSLRDELESIKNKALERLSEHEQKDGRMISEIRSGIEQRFREQHPEFEKQKDELEKLNDELKEIQEVLEGRRLLLTEFEKCYGIGRLGNEFVRVVEVLEPHLAEVNRRVNEQIALDIKMGKKCRPLYDLRQKELDVYAKEHPEIVPMLTVRDKVLNGVGELHLCNT